MTALRAFSFRAAAARPSASSWALTIPTLNRPGLENKMSIALWPIEPVTPRILSVLDIEKFRIEIKHDCKEYSGEHQRVPPVKQPAMTRNKRAGILDAA